MKKEAIKKIVSAVGIIFILAVIGFAVCIALFIHDFNEQADKDYAEACEDFKIVYQYVLENKEAYKEFSEYQLSLMNEDNSYMIIERDGDMQEMRDIVLEPFGYYANAGINVNGEAIVNYSREASETYMITCSYYKDGINRSPYGNDREKLIDDCIWLVLSPHPDSSVI